MVNIHNMKRQYKAVIFDDDGRQCMEFKDTQPKHLKEKISNFIKKKLM